MFSDGVSDWIVRAWIFVEKEAIARMAYPSLRLRINRFLIKCGRANGTSRATTGSYSIRTF